MMTKSLLVALSLAPLLALACVDLILDDEPCGGPLVSGRVMTFYSEVRPRIIAIGQGADLTLRDVAKDTPSQFVEDKSKRTFKAKYGE